MGMNIMLIRDSMYAHVKRTQGFSLVELLVVIVIAGIVMTSVYSMLFTQQRSYQVQEQVVEVQQGLRAGLDLLLYELRMAGYDPDDDDLAGITAASAESVTFTLVADDDGEDNDSDTTVDESGELKTVEYSLYDAYTDGDNDLGRQVGSSASTKRAVAENIEAVEFQYFDEDGNVTAVLDEIRSIQVAILARTNRIDNKYTDTNVYYTDADGVDWGPYGDSYRRRFQLMTVRCRNLGL
jgi:type IV pilus assembly protein PilW